VNYSTNVLSRLTLPGTARAGERMMVSQDATTDQMFEAAKYINAFWFPQQTLGIAIYIQTNNG